MKKLLMWLALWSSFSTLFAQKEASISILVTSPAGYATRFQKQFEGSKLTPVVIPMIETVIPKDCKEVDLLLKRLNDYDYLAFSSRKAIESFALRLQKDSTDWDKLNNVKCCAIGKDAEYLQEMLHCSNAVQPEEPSPMGIVCKLKEIPNISGKSIAVLAPKVEGMTEPDVVPEFICALQKLNMKVTRIPAYITRATNRSTLVRATELIRNGKVACIAFTSGTEIEVLLNALENNASLLSHTTIACFGPYTANYAKKKGLKVEIVAKDFSSFEGFVNAIQDYFKE